MTPTVQLRRASLPLPLGLLADHHWFTLLDPTSETWHRWELWQTKNAGGTSWGHVHQNLNHPRARVGGGPCILVHEWTGTDAQRLAEILTQPESYPHRTRYRPFPGPNSNTYVAWILKQAGINHPLNWKAIGRKFQ